MKRLVCVLECSLQKKASGAPRAGVTVDCQPHDMCAGNQTQALYKSCLYSEVLSHLSSLRKDIFDKGNSVVVFEVSLEAELAT